MKEIIFWFSKHKIKNYWLNYAIDFWKEHFAYYVYFHYNKIEDWIQIGDLKILFKVDEGSKSYIGWGDTNQYWVEGLFDNNFEDFFMSIVKEEIKDGKETERK